MIFVFEWMSDVYFADLFFFFFQAEDGIRDLTVTGVQTCALPISVRDGITGLTPHVRSGRLRLLAITNRTRVPLWPDTPAAAETVGGYESGGWFGYVAPAGTARAIILKLNDEINRAMKLPDVSDKLVTAGLIIVAESPEYFGEVIRSDYAKYGKLVRDIGFQPQ